MMTRTALFMAMTAAISAPPAGPAFSDVLLGLSPWGYWKLDDASAAATSTAVDASGNSRHGTYTGAGTTAQQPAVFAGSTAAIITNGSGRVNLPDWGAINNVKFSIVCCFKTTSTGIRSLLSSDNGSTVRQYQFRLEDGAIRVVGLGTGSVNLITANLNANDGNSHMVVLVMDPTLPVAQGQTKIYFDGALVLSSTDAAVFASNQVARPAIGSRSSSGQSEGFIGTLDEAAVFVGTALTAANVTSLWNARSTPSVPSAYQYWNPADKTADAIVDNGNKTVHGDGSGAATRMVRSITSKTSGKRRVQFLCGEDGDSVAFGFSFGQSAFGAWLGNGQHVGLWGNYAGPTLRLYYNNTTVSSPSGTVANGDVIDLLIDIDAGKAWWRKNGVVIAGDPVAGTGAMFTWTPSGQQIFLAADAYAGTASVTLRTDPAEMTGSPVAGFTDGWPV